jgi:hypothetical protein
MRRPPAGETLTVGSRYQCEALFAPYRNASSCAGAYI